MTSDLCDAGTYTLITTELHCMKLLIPQLPERVVQFVIKIPKNFNLCNFTESFKLDHKLGLGAITSRDVFAQMCVNPNNILYVSFIQTYFFLFLSY